MKTEVLNEKQILRICNRFAFQIIEPTEEGAPLTSSGNANIDRILFYFKTPKNII